MKDASSTNVTPEAAEMITRWLRKADCDLNASRILLERDACPYDAAAYHAEQAALKLLKAWLTFHDVCVPRSQDLQHLHSLLPEEKRLPVRGEDLSYLSPYGIDSWWDPDRAQAERALGIAADLREKVVSALPFT